LKDRWAVDWLRWSGYPKFWSQLVRETMRRRDDNEYDFRVVRDGDEAKITINAVRKDASSGTSWNRRSGCSPDESVAEVSVRQVGPRILRKKAKFRANRKKGHICFRAVAKIAVDLREFLPIHIG